MIDAPSKDDEAWSVYVPSLPGCFSAGDTLAEALANAREAIELQLEFLLDNGEPLPDAQAALELPPVKEVRAVLVCNTQTVPERLPLFAVVSVSPEVLDETVERINLSVPRRILHRIDRAAETAHMSRSAFLAEAGLEAASRRLAPSAPEVHAH